MSQGRSDVPQGYAPINVEPPVREIPYEAFAEGREVTYVSTRRITGKNGRSYNLHVVRNDKGAQRGLWGCAQLDHLLSRAGAGAVVFIRYDGKQTGRNGNMEHTWVVAVASEHDTTIGNGEDDSPF